MENKIISPQNNIVANISETEESLREAALKSLINTPIPNEELMDTIPLFLNRHILQRILFLDKIYQNILNLNGVIMEFGVRWGANLATLALLRSIYEPYNPFRKIIGFDTFDGFPEVHTHDGEDVSIAVGSHTVTKDYEEYLSSILSLIEKSAPISHLKKFELVKGDAVDTVENYIMRHQETLVSLAYFDFDIYLPTIKVLETIKPRLLNGSILAFDELNYTRYPGETIAFLEFFCGKNPKVIRSPISSAVSYVVYET